MLERRVEVDVVGDRERAAATLASSSGTRSAPARTSSSIRATVSSQDDRPSARNGLSVGRLEHRAEAVRGEVEDPVADAEPDSRLVAADREDAEPDRAGHAGSIPRASSSSIGSKKLQLPIEWKSLAPHPFEFGARRYTAPPREGVRVERECGAVGLPERRLLVAGEHDRGEQVEERRARRSSAPRGAGQPSP